jgi:hypothetical protein
MSQTSHDGRARPGLVALFDAGLVVFPGRRMALVGVLAQRPRAKGCSENSSLLVLGTTHYYAHPPGELKPNCKPRQRAPLDPQAKISS